MIIKHYIEIVEDLSYNFLKSYLSNYFVCFCKKINN